MSVSRVRENRTHGSMRRREAARCRWPPGQKGRNASRRPYIAVRARLPRARPFAVSLSHASCTLGVREVCRSRAAEVRPPSAPTSTRASPRTRSTAPWARGVSRAASRLAPGNRELKPAGDPLLVFPSIFFALQRDLPEREPTRHVLLERQLVSHLGLQAQLALVVARLVALRRHERVVRAALEVVDEVDRAALFLEGEHRAQQAVTVALPLERRRD